MHQEEQHGGSSCRTREEGGECTRGDNMKVQLSKFFDKRGLNFVNLEVIVVRLAAQGISHYISLA